MKFIDKGTKDDKIKKKNFIFLLNGIAEQNVKAKKGYKLVEVSSFIIENFLGEELFNSDMKSSNMSRDFFPVGDFSSIKLNTKINFDWRSDDFMDSLD